MADDIFEVIKQRNNYYRDNYRRLVVAMLVLLLLCSTLIVVIIYQYTTWPEPGYFATTADGRIIPITPLSR